ncbi:MAG TPA: class I SAM-dependent methyltransferase [Acidimicrobiales bacterium]|nr:class I SAM-dependent methyltransferase [Acidimicrobiales bacterium]
MGPANVIGVDLNEAMLAVARQVRPDVQFRQADASALPFEERYFDTVLSQMALMFFTDRAASLREMARVTAHSGTLAVVVPGRSSTKSLSPASSRWQAATPAPKPIPF